MSLLEKDGTNDAIGQSLQEANRLMEIAYTSQKIIAGFDQKMVDRIVKRMADVGFEEATRLAIMAVSETKMGVIRDKTTKNQFASRNVYNAIKEMRTVDVISENLEAGVVEMAIPMGVVVGIIPTTNPTSTIIYKAMIAIKSRNAIVFSPHPRAIQCSMEAARVMEQAAISAGAPKGLIQCLSISTREATDLLMRHQKTAVILATGGSAMVKAAYSSGNPAYGVGPGNVPAFIEHSADIRDAIEKIISSKTFDNGTVCASEQAILVERQIHDLVMTTLKKAGGHFVSGIDAVKLERTVIQPNGGVNPEVVGQSVETIAKLADIAIPSGTKVLLTILKGVGKAVPLSAEKLCPVLGYYVVDRWEEAAERCKELLQYGGLGHSLSIHSRNEQVIEAFGKSMPVFRILVNTPSSQGAIGYTTNLMPALTLGCGTLGGSITSDNVSPLHLINRKRIAWHQVREGTEKSEQTVQFCYTSAEIRNVLEAIRNANVSLKR